MTAERKNNSVDVYELFEVNNDFHDAVVRLANVYAIGIAEVLEHLNGCANAFASVAEGITRSLEPCVEQLKNLGELVDSGSEFRND